MAEAEHQRSFVEHNGDQEPDQGLDQVHNGIQYQVHDQTQDQPEYQVDDQTVGQAECQLPDQLEYQQYQAQDQSEEQLQDRAQDQLQYQPQDQLQYQPQDQLQYQPQDQEQYQPQDQEQYQLHNQDQVEYQVEGQAQDQTEDQMQVQEDMFQNTEPEQKPESLEGAADGGEAKRWPGWPGETVFRMLVPAQKVGSIIGRKGDVIKKIVEETRARIKILDGPPGTLERAVMISAKEEPDSSLPPSMDGLLRVHKRIVDGLEGDSAQVPPAKVSTRLLVPASQAGSLIGKQGGTVKSIQEASSCIVRVLGTEDLPVFALQDDRVVEVVGDPVAVHKALELIASHLRKFLVDRSIIPLFETQMQKPNHQMDHMPPHKPWGPPPGLPPNAGGGPGYGHNPPPYMAPPPRHVDNYYAPPEMRPPPMEKQPHQGISAYGREPALGVHASPAPSMVAQQVTQHMQIPLSYADAVIGTSGSSISYIRRASGATVTIQESRGAPGEMTVEISGTASQVQTAQQLIQNFMAEAGAPAPTPTQAAGSVDQAYNPYAAHSSVYASPASNPGLAAHPGGYGTDYGSGYGY